MNSQVKHNDTVVDEKDKEIPEDRNPNKLHSELKLSFEDIFAEPDESVFSFDRVWKYSKQIFKDSKFCWYKFISVLCALPTALCWGLCFASFAYFSIWCLQPCVRLSGLKWCFEFCCKTLKYTAKGVGGAFGAS